MLFHPFFALDQTAHHEGNHAHADTGLNAEKQAFNLTGQLAADGSFQNGRCPGLVGGVDLFDNLTACVVRAAELRVLEDEERNQSDQTDGQNDGDDTSFISLSLP